MCLGHHLESLELSIPILTHQSFQPSFACVETGMNTVLISQSLFQRHGMSSQEGLHPFLGLQPSPTQYQTDEYNLASHYFHIYPLLQSN